MPLIEEIEQLLTKNEQPPIAPRACVQETLDQSRIEDIVDGIVKKFGISREQSIIEQGQKVVLDLKWKKGQLDQRMVLSIRAGRIAFMGSFTPPHYLVIEDDQLGDRSLVERYFAQTFTSPQVINEHQ